MNAIPELELLRKQLLTYRRNHVPWKGCVAFCRGIECVIQKPVEGFLSCVETFVRIYNDDVKEITTTTSKKNIQEFMDMAWEWLLDLYAVQNSDMNRTYIHPIILSVIQKTTLRLFTDGIKTLSAINRSLRTAMHQKRDNKDDDAKDSKFQSWMLTITDPIRWYRSSLMKRISWEKELVAFPALNYRLAWNDYHLKTSLDQKYSSKLSYGARGAFESHVQMWQRHATEKNEMVVKYSEDDMVPSPIYQHTLKQLVHLLQEASHNLDLDFIWLGYHMPLEERMQAMLNLSNRYLKEGPPPFQIGGMFGYIIPKRDSAQKLYNLFKTTKILDVGVDTWIMNLSSAHFKQAHFNLPILFSQYWMPHHSQTQRSDCGPSWNFYPLEEHI